MNMPYIFELLYSDLQDDGVKGGMTFRTAWES